MFLLAIDLPGVLSLAVGLRIPGAAVPPNMPIERPLSEPPPSGPGLAKCLPSNVLQLPARRSA